MTEDQRPKDVPPEDVVDQDALLGGPGWVPGDVPRGADSPALPEWTTEDLTVDGTG